MSTNPTLNRTRLAARVARALSVVGANVGYRLGGGGMDPAAVLPGRPGAIGVAGNGCDCSGFALAWCFGLARCPKASRPYWIATETVYADAMSKTPRAFVRVADPVPGCAVVYPDRKVLGVTQQGHCGLVTNVARDANGKVTDISGVDCSSGSYKRTGKAIALRSLAFFWASKPIYVVLIEDYNV